MTGNLTVVTGCMYSGKTSELIDQATSSVSGEEAIFFQPKIKGEYVEDTISSRNGKKRSCVPVPAEEPDGLKSHIVDEDVIAIDEVQFFDTQEAIRLIKELLEEEYDVVVSGLDLDFKGDMFDPVPYLMCMADEVKKLTAECAICGEDATMTQRLINDEPASKEDDLIAIGSEKYEPRCRSCHIV